jgi:hypothetical protein
VAGNRDNGKSLFGIVAALMLGLGTSFGVAGADGPDCGGQAGGRR